MITQRKSIILALPATAAALLSLWLGCSGKEDNPTDNGKTQVRTYTLTTAWMPLDGGTVTIVPDLTAYPAGDTVTVTAAAAEGYVFGGWSGSATTAAPTVTLVMSGNKTLATYFYPIGSPPPGTVDPDSTAPATPTDTAKTPTDTAQTVTPPPAGTYTITASTNPKANAGWVTLDPDQKFYVAGIKVSAKATAADKYIFTKWSGSSTAASASITLTMNANKEITANFEERTYKLSAAAAPANGGTVTLNPNLDAYSVGAKVTATATPAQNYTFTKWSGAATSTSATATITMDGNKTLTANFQMQDTATYTLTVNASPQKAGTVDLSPNQTGYLAGTKVTVTAIATENYLFSKWAGASSSTSANIIITMNEDKNLTANFKPDGHTIVIDINPPNGGTVTRTPDLEVYPPNGDDVILTAIPAKYYKFTEWTGTGTGVASNRQKSTISISTANDRLIMCSFAKADYTLTTNLKINNGGGTISRSPNHATFQGGEQVTVTAVPAPGFYFVGWSEGITSTNPTVTITMDNHKTLTALFLSDHLEMVFVKGGTFTMGCTPEQGNDCGSNEKPAHQVTLSDFYIGKYEISQKIWTEIMGTNPSKFKQPTSSDYTLVGDKLEQTQLPVDWVSYAQAVTFADRLANKTGIDFRLPTEAEWEYAARGGINSRGYKYAGSNNFDDVGLYGANNNVQIKTYHIRAYAPNELGIYNMSGNVCEWVSDELKQYIARAQTNPSNNPQDYMGNLRILRGGSWRRTAKESRNSYRHQDDEPDTKDDGGFRLVIPAP